MSPVTPSFPASSEHRPGRPETAPRLRLDFLDGMRGLAALYVMLSHIYILATYDDARLSPSLLPAFAYLTRPWLYAHFAVDVFIVLSGFCLMLPVVRARDRALPGGLLGFARRRARRMLPPYYVALLFVIGALLVTHHFKHGAQDLADLSAGDLLVHGLLLQNLFQNFSMALDLPMWSVAWEWQIYFFFALLLLPLWRRFGISAAVALGFFLGYLPMLLLPRGQDFTWTLPWYLGLFALGMAAAVVLSSGKERYRLLKSPRFQNPALGLASAVMLLLAFTRPQWLGWDGFWLTDPFVGAVTALFILTCALRTETDSFPTVIVRALSSRPMMTLGAFSYSLYLVHFPILHKMQDLLHKHHLSHYLQFALMLLIGIPVCLVAAYLFHLAFERPFMSKPAPQTERQAERAAIISPAP